MAENNSNTGVSNTDSTANRRRRTRRATWSTPQQESSRDVDNGCFASGPPSQRYSTCSMDGSRPAVNGRALGLPSYYYMFPPSYWNTSTCPMPGRCWAGCPFRWFQRRR